MYLYTSRLCFDTDHWAHHLGSRVYYTRYAIFIYAHMILYKRYASVFVPTGLPPVSFRPTVRLLLLLMPLPDGRNDVDNADNDAVNADAPCSLVCRCSHVHAVYIVFTNICSTYYTTGSTWRSAVVVSSTHIAFQYAAAVSVVCDVMLLANACLINAWRDLCGRFRSHMKCTMHDFIYATTHVVFTCGEHIHIHSGALFLSDVSYVSMCFFVCGYT